MYFKGFQVEFLTDMFLSLKMVLNLANSVDLDEVPHFILVFTVCQCTHLGVGLIQCIY